MTTPATKFRRAPAVPETSASGIPGRADFQTIWKDPDRFVEQYYAHCKNRKSRDWRDWPYMAGDGALQAADAYFRILSRIDDVINVAGHRLGTKEIESASLLVEEIAEAAVVPVRDEIKGRVPDLYMSLRPGLAKRGHFRKRVEGSVIREGRTLTRVVL
jgi:acetyl-CoA synthetase